MRWASLVSSAQRAAILDLAQRNASARPDLPASHLAWGTALDGAGRHEEALARLEEACGRFPDDEALHCAYAAALSRAGRIDASAAVVAGWTAAPWARKLEFKLLTRSGRTDRLAEREAALAEADPADPDLLEYRARKWRGRPERMLVACDDVLAHDPKAIHAVYHKALALVQLGRPEEAADLMGLERYLRIVRLGTPAPFGDEAAFLAQLEKEIVGNPTLHADPAGHATRKGLRTATFPLPSDRGGQALVSALLAKVGEYADALTDDHPFPAARPTTATFKSWALVFHSSGHQVLHRHPGPWLTGVYYVAAPTGPARPGALRIGALPPELGVQPPWPVIDVEPVPGTLVLFPSYVPHETIASGSEEVRISVAFDVAPA